MKQYFNKKWLKAILGTFLISVAVPSNAQTKMAEVMMDISPQEMLSIVKSNEMVTRSAFDDEYLVFKDKNENKYAIGFGDCTPDDRSVTRRCEFIYYTAFLNGNIKGNLLEKANELNQLGMFSVSVNMEDNSIIIHRYNEISGMTENSVKKNFSMFLKGIMFGMESIIEK